MIKLFSSCNDVSDGMEFILFELSAGFSHQDFRKPLDPGNRCLKVVSDQREKVSFQFFDLREDFVLFLVLPALFVLSNQTVRDYQVITQKNSYQGLALTNPEVLELKNELAHDKEPACKTQGEKN